MGYDAADARHGNFLQIDSEEGYKTQLQKIIDVVNFRIEPGQGKLREKTSRSCRKGCPKLCENTFG